MKKIESLTLKRYEDNRFEAKLVKQKDNGKDSIQKKPSPMITEAPLLPKRTSDHMTPTIEGLNGFMFSTAKKSDKKVNTNPENKRTIYKINLSSLNPTKELPVDIQSLYKVNAEEEGKIKDFFKMNPIDKVELKERFFGRDQESFEVDRDMYSNDDLDEKVSSFLLKFK